MGSSGAELLFCLGVWEFGSFGVWEFGSLGVWVFGCLVKPASRERDSKQAQC